MNIGKLFGRLFETRSERHQRWLDELAECNQRLRKLRESVASRKARIDDYAARGLYVIEDTFQLYEIECAYVRDLEKKVKNLDRKLTPRIPLAA